MYCEDFLLPLSSQLVFFKWEVLDNYITLLVFAVLSDAVTKLQVQQSLTTVRWSKSHTSSFYYQWVLPVWFKRFSFCFRLPSFGLISGRHTCPLWNKIQFDYIWVVVVKKEIKHIFVKKQNKKNSTIYFAERLISQNKYYVHIVCISSLKFFFTKWPRSDWKSHNCSIDRPSLHFSLTHHLLQHNNLKTQL